MVIFARQELLHVRHFFCFWEELFVDKILLILIKKIDDVFPLMSNIPLYILKIIHLWSNFDMMFSVI